MSLLLEPIAAMFRLGVALRHGAYRRRWLKVRKLNRPVISVGNLTVGGTGKTPFVAWLARRLLERGWKPSILTRGYRRRGRSLISLAPGTERVTDPRRVGDEPALLARALPEVPIVVGANRYEAGKLAEREYNVDVHLLDDGFQHLALARDVDIVLVDVTQKFSDRALLPAGPLREPCAALARADMIVLTRVDLGDPEPVEGQVSRINPQAKIFHSTTKLCGLVDVATGRIYPTAAFHGEPVRAFCGLGNPKAFFADLKKWGFSVVGENSFRDHHDYSNGDVEALELSARKSGAAALMTTEKDTMNLPPLGGRSLPFVACVIQTDVREAQALEDTLLGRLEVRRGIGTGGTTAGKHAPIVSGLGP